MSKLLTIAEASELTRLSVKTLYSYACQRKVPFVKLGGKLLFDEDRIRKWIDAHSIEPTAAAARGRSRA